MVANTAVMRVRKFALPAEPNTPCALPEPPKPAPASAPLPCCISTRQTTPIDEKILITKISVLKAAIGLLSVLCGLDDGGKGIVFERCAANECAVNVGYAKNFGGIGIVYAAAIKNADISIVAT